MKEEKIYRNLELWNIEATFEYDYKGQKGSVCICFGFPDYNSKGGNAEFEVNIKSMVPEKSLSAKEKRDLKSKLLSVMDNQKLTVYSNFLNYLNNRDAK